MAKKGKLSEKAVADEVVKEQLPPDTKAVLQTLRDSFKSWKLIVGILATLLVIAACTWVWGAIKDKSELTNDEIVIRVSRELQIIGDGNPAILTVNDEEKVSQPFLEDAKNGDVVLLYYKAGKSALFRPSEDKIIRSGTYTPPDAKAFIRDGTTDDTKIAGAKDKLKNLENITVVSQDASAKQDYTTTVVIDITDRYPNQVKNIAEILGAQIVRLPKGETVPDGDILIVVGKQ